MPGSAPRRTGADFYSTRPGGHGLRDLYISRREDKHGDLAAWGPPQNLDAVNSSADDWLASAFEDDDDGVTLYFASDRGGPTVLTDVYASTRRDDDGDFGEPTPVAELNGKYHDGWPRVRRDGLEIFVTSQRSTGLGDVDGTDNDIWTATRCSNDEPWGPLAPVAQLNTGSVQSGGALSRDGTRLYFVSPTGSMGGVDIWQSTRVKLHGDDDEATCDDGGDDGHGDHDQDHDNDRDDGDD